MKLSRVRVWSSSSPCVQEREREREREKEFGESTTILCGIGLVGFGVGRWVRRIGPVQF